MMDDELKRRAEAAAEMSTCSRRKVGAAIQHPQGIFIFVGWNEERGGMLCESDCPRAKSGLPSGAPFTGEGACIADHAEMQAIKNLQGFFGEIDLQGAQMYATVKPCSECWIKLGEMGIHVEWGEEYGD